MKTMYFVIISIIWKSIYSKKEKSISFDIKYYDPRPYLSLNFPEVENSFITYVNTYLPYSNFRFYYFIKIIQSRQLEEKTLNLFNSYQSMECKTKININNIEYSDFFIYITRNYSFSEDEGIAFGYKFDNNNFSLIHLLYQSKQIEHMMFAFYHQNNEGKVYIGNIPGDQINEYSYKGSCNVRDDLNHWGCLLNQIEYNGLKYQMDKYAIIHSGVDVMFLSNDIYDFMEQNVFMEFIEQKICSIWVSLHKTKSLYCRENEFMDKFSKEQIRFRLGNMIINIPFTNLFKSDGSYLKSYFYSNPFNFHDDDIIIGITFLNQFNFSVFDYETNQISFYSNDTIIFMEENISVAYELKSVQILLFLNIIINGFGGLFLLIFFKEVNNVY